MSMRARFVWAAAQSWMLVDMTGAFLVSLSSAYYKETLLNDIRRAREKYQGDELAKELARIKLRMDNTQLKKENNQLYLCYFCLYEA